MMSYNNNWVNDLRKSLKESEGETQDILKQIEANHQDAAHKAEEARAAAEQHKGNKERHAHFTAIMKHHLTHKGNYEQAYRNVTAALKAGDHKRAKSEGSQAAYGKPHMIDVPHYPDLGTPKQQVEEEMALNQDLLMLIDVLCEELGIDTEELLKESLSEARKMVSKKVRQNPEDKAALHAKLHARLDQLTDKHDEQYEKGGMRQWPESTPEKDQTAENLRPPSRAAVKALKAIEEKIKKHMKLMAKHGAL